jgi:predicted dehydrogenase
MKIAIVGFAHGHYGAYCTQWAAHPDWGHHPYQGMGPRPGQTRQVAENLKLKAVENLDDLLGDSEIDAFLVTAETSMPRRNR